MHVLVTGATGFVGSHVVTTLLGAGHDVRCLVRNPARLDAAFADTSFADTSIVGSSRDRIDVAVGDVLDPASVVAGLDGCDAVVHAAGAVGVARAHSGSRDVNIEGTRNVVGLAVDAGCDPVIYTSSVVVLDDSPRVLTAASALGAPSGPYGRSKLAAEQCVRGMQSRGAPITTFYVGGVFGPDAPEVGSAMAGIVGAVNQLMPVTVGGVGMIDVRDLAALVAAGLQPGHGPRRYMAGGQFLTWAEWTDLLDEVTGRQVRRVRVPGGVLRAAGSVLDAAKRIRDFDYPLTHEAAVQMTTSRRTDDRSTFDELGVVARPVAETLGDCVRWLVRSGHIDRRRAPALHA